jgi:guanylate kinase
MVSGLLVLTSNRAFKNILAEKYFINKNPEEIAERIIKLSQLEPDSNLCDYVVKNHNLENLIKKIVFYL